MDLGRGAARLTVLAGPTAVGKGTVAADDPRAVPGGLDLGVGDHPQPRPGERRRALLWFVSDAEFDRMVAAGELLEWAVVHKAARYGTPRSRCSTELADGRPALLEIDLQGARQVRETMPEALFVFLAAAELGGAGPPARRPRHRDGRGAGAPAGHRPGRAGGREGVRRDDRERLEVQAAADELVALMKSDHASDLSPTERLNVSAPSQSPRASPTRRSTTCSPRPTPSTSWSSTAPSARAADQRLLLPARRGPAGVRRPAGRDPRPGEAAVDRAARDQRGPADLRGHRPRGRGRRRGGGAPGRPPRASARAMPHP